MEANPLMEVPLASPQGGGAALHLQLPADGRPSFCKSRAARTGRFQRGWRGWAVILSALIGVAAAARVEASQSSGATPVLAARELGSAVETIPQRRSPPTREMRGFRFRLLGCERSSALVRCTLQVTSLRGDRSLDLCGNNDCGNKAVSVAFSGSGIDHRAQNAVLGSRSSPYRVRNELIEGEAMNAIVEFEDVPTRASALTRLRVAFNDMDSGFFVEFSSIFIR